MARVIAYVPVASSKCSYVYQISCVIQKVFFSAGNVFQQINDDDDDDDD